MVVDYAHKFAPNSNEITLKQAELTVEGIKQICIDCPSETAKYDALVKLYGLMTIGSSIIFVKVNGFWKYGKRLLTGSNRGAIPPWRLNGV